MVQARKSCGKNYSEVGEESEVEEESGEEENKDKKEEERKERKEAEHTFYCCLNETLSLFLTNYSELFVTL